MNTRRPSPLLLVLFLLSLGTLPPGVAHARQPALDASLQRVADAIHAAQHGKTHAARLPALVDHPLYGWIEYAGLRRDIDTLPVASGEGFLQRHRGTAVAGAFREIWLPALARREDWRAFNASWSPAIKATSLRCMSLQARARTGGADAQWVTDAQAIWRSTGKSLPNECDAPLAL